MPGEIPGNLDGGASLGSMLILVRLQEHPPKFSKQINQIIMKGIEIIYTQEQFKELGFDGEIAKYMREHQNTAIVGTDKGYNHVVSFVDWKTLSKYRETFKP